MTPFNETELLAAIALLNFLTELVRWYRDRRK